MTDEQYKHSMEKAKELAKDIDVEFRGAAFKVLLNHLIYSLDLPPRTTSFQTTSISSTPSEKESKNRDSKRKEGPSAHLKELIDETFFQTPKSMKQILDELESRSYHYKDTDLTKQLQLLVRGKFLRRTSAPNEKGRQVTHWVNW